jgi:hypothetical protein
MFTKIPYQTGAKSPQAKSSALPKTPILANPQIAPSTK